MDKKNRDYESAVLVHQNLCIKSNCFMPDGNIKKTDFLVCIDDDPTSAIYAVRLAKMHRKAYGIYPYMLCVGNKGLLSRWTHKTTEGKFLRDICIRLGFPSDLTIVLDKGRNTGENILNIKKYLTDARCLDKTVLFSCTKRLSLRMMLTQQKQAPEVKASYFVVNESFNQACKWYNGKRLGNCTMMYHELASILNRCEAYAGTFQESIPFPVSEKVRDAAAWLENRYRLKLPNKNLRSYFQFAYLLFNVLIYKKQMMAELGDQISCELAHNDDLRY